MKNFCLIAAMFFLQNVNAQSAYLCRETNSTGFVYDVASHAFKTKIYPPQETFVLKKLNEIKWEWKVFESKSGWICTNKTTNELNCNLGDGELRFNFKSMKYIRTFTQGYDYSEPSNEFLRGEGFPITPWVSIGTCTEI